MGLGLFVWAALRDGDSASDSAIFDYIPLPLLGWLGMAFDGRANMLPSSSERLGSTVRSNH